MTYQPRINVLHIDDAPATHRAFHADLASRGIFVHTVATLEDARAVLRSCRVDLLLSDGIFPVRKGGKPQQSFVPLMTYLRKHRRRLSIIAWSNSTEVHAYCLQHEIESYSKMVLTRARFRQKGRAYIPVRALSRKRMAERVEQHLMQQYRIADILRSVSVQSYYTEPATVLGAFLACDMRTGLFHKTAGRNYAPILTEMTKGLANIHIDPISDAKISRSIYLKIVQGGYFSTIERQVAFRAHILITFARKLRSASYTTPSNEHLAKLYTTFCEKFMQMRMYSSLPTALEHESNRWTKLLTSIIKRKIPDAQEQQRVFSILTTPERMSYLYDFETVAARLGLRQARGKNIQKELKKFVERYAWIRYTFSGIPITVADAQKTIRSLGKTEKDFRALLQKRSRYLPSLRREKQKLLRQYRFSKQDAAFFAIGANIVFLKYFRKGIFAESYYSVEFLLAAIGRRIGCSTDEVAALLPHEVLAGLRVGHVSQDLPRFRVRQSWLLSADGHTYAVGNSLVPLIKSRIEQQKNATSIQGQVAYSGKVQGTVKIVNAVADMKKMRAGDVLVSRSTNPSLLPAMHQASAFVTDIGGLTCHAAIIAREMKKPCIVGTKSATMLLKDGDKVEVDAKQGVVRKLSSR